MSMKHLQSEQNKDLKIKVIGANGEVEWNGEEMGELLICGPWIADEYVDDERSKVAFREGWLHTGDGVTSDKQGFIKIVDRTNQKWGRMDFVR